METPELLENIEEMRHFAMSRTERKAILSDTSQNGPQR